MILIPKLTETLSIARERSPLEYSTVSLIGSENSGMITVLVMWEGLLVSSCGLILAIVSRLPVSARTMVGLHVVVEKIL